MLKITGIIVIVGVLGLLHYRRQSRLWRAENEVRTKLALPLLTRRQFGMKVVEKSAEFRANINQHM
ncbi:MAG: hypothetical protein ACPG8W_24830 [Candidatus Promineifilaceae bacterium]